MLDSFGVDVGGSSESRLVVDMLGCSSVASGKCHGLIVDETTLLSFHT